MQELMCGLTRYFVDYNEERPHQSLGYQTPNVVHSTSAGGGAMIVDRFSREEKAETGQRRSAASEERTIA
jgi:putative transposase